MMDKSFSMRWDDFKCFIAFHIIVFRQRIRYSKIIRRIREYSPDRKIRVLFWVSSTSKWKTQSLYERMAASDKYEPIIGLSVGTDDVLVLKDAACIDNKLAKDQAFYESLGARCVRLFDVATNESVPISSIRPDIVFFQEPKMFFPIHEPRIVARDALCCYMPYSIKQNGAYMSYLYEPSFHSLMYLQIALNEEDARFVRKGLPWCNRAGIILGLGHTILDEFNMELSSVSEQEMCTIYAPHFSFSVKGVERPIILSDFLRTGVPMLEYAQAHPELNWVFKPHPNLKRELVNTGGWSTEKVAEYYAGWERVGHGYYDGDYIKLFKTARVMITDCGSFLSEFSATGRPVIRLVPDELNFPVRPAFRALFSSFYEVRGLQQLKQVLRQVVECGEDPKKDERRAAAEKLGLLNSNSASKIMDFFGDLFKLK